MADVTVEATTYTVSLLPETADEYTLYAITVERRGPAGWAVVRNRWCLGADGEWEFEPIPSERTDEWIAAHRFPLEQALELAKAAAPGVTVNGWSAAKVQELGGLVRG
ncbi:hypothetical protein [Plantactinospora sp. WMMB782]|uniref:hypothetical protein n=1 Tax=Plantactinospora sp. WMMB782 TaxID=3404121 RepID=UPI003B964BFE